MQKSYQLSDNWKGCTRAMSAQGVVHKYLSQFKGHAVKTKDFSLVQTFFRRLIFLLLMKLLICI